MFNLFLLQILLKFRGLTGFSHLHILWWANRVNSPKYRNTTAVDKPYKQGPDKLGIYATRSPIRPNPIAYTVVYVTRIDHENGVIYTPYIDAEPDTPVLDIKIIWSAFRFILNWVIMMTYLIRGRS